MLDRDPKANGRAVIEDVDCEPLQVHDLREASYYLGQLCERVRKRVVRRHIGLSEPRQVRRNDVEAIGEQRDEIAKHMAAGRETMQQQQRWRVGWSALQAYVRRLRLHCPSHSRVGFRCGLVAADLIIDAEPTLEDIQQAGSLELSPGNLGRVVGQGKKPETGVSQFPKRVRYLRVRRH
jgi:hypothetical protein